MLALDCGCRLSGFDEDNDLKYGNQDGGPLPASVQDGQDQTAESPTQKKGGEHTPLQKPEKNRKDAARDGEEELDPGAGIEPYRQCGRRREQSERHVQPPDAVPSGS